MPTTLHASRIDLSKDIRQAMVRLLNQHLANAADLHSQTKQAHWNVKGMHFYQLHELFDEMAGRLREQVDMIAERATALGGTASGTVRMAAAASKLPEHPAEALEDRNQVEVLAERFALYGAGLRGAIEEATKAGDADTADLFTEASREVDKDLWFLEAHLQGAATSTARS